MNLRKLNKLSRLNPPLHLLPPHEMIVHPVLLALARFSRRVAHTEPEGLGWQQGRVGGGEGADYRAFAYSGGAADY